MVNRRQFIHAAAVASLATVTPLSVHAESRRLPVRPIPGTDEVLPIIGMGNSNAFREGDAEASWNVIRMFQEYGSRYIDLSGSSRFVVADVVREHGIADSVFLGTYFSGEKDVQSEDEAQRLLEITLVRLAIRQLRRQLGTLLRPALFQFFTELLRLLQTLLKLLLPLLMLRVQFAVSATAIRQL